MSEIPEQVNVHDYIEEKYKEEWLKEACGWNSNRWEQYEKEYQISLMEYSDMYQMESIYNAMVEEQDELRELYYEIHETPMEDQISLRDDEEELLRIRTEAEAYQTSMTTDSAALDAFNIVAPVAGVDDEARMSDIEQSLRTSTITKNDAEIAKLEAAAKEKAESTAVPEYLVRGAPLRCLYGSHTRYLDMKETHGVYLGDDKPLIHSRDSKVDENIFSFGICKCPSTTLTERTSLMKGAEVDQKGNYLYAPDDQVITGIACKPRLAALWQNTNKEADIARNAAKGVSAPLASANYSAVTNTSYLLCREGGYIYPLSSGQLEYTSYFAEFHNYPFEDIYSDAFYKWCDIKNVCPYYPGTAEYTDWYQEKLAKTTDKKEKKQLYEDYLAGAYQIGLDRMDNDEREKVKDIRDEYLSSDLLKDKEKKELQNKYAGLRVDYGYNNQKNIAGATPKEDEFYTFYLDEAKSYDQQLAGLREELIEAAGRYDDGELQYISNQMQQVRADKAKVYERYSAEIKLYEGLLNEEAEEMGQAVADAFSQVNFGE